MNDMNEKRKYYNPIVEESSDIDKLITKYGIHMQLHSLRQKAHISQQQLADISDLSVGTISRVETGKEITLQTVIKYANVFGYDLILKKKNNVWPDDENER